MNKVDEELARRAEELVDLIRTVSEVSDPDSEYWCRDPFGESKEKAAEFLRGLSRRAANTNQPNQ